jgi:membrane-associated phospholipid phosphatase
MAIKKVQLPIQKRIASLALLSVELITVLVLFIAALIIFSIFAYRVLKWQNHEFDFLVFDKVSQWVTPLTTSFIQAITFLGNHNFLVPVNLVLIVYFLFIKKHRWYSIKVPVIALGGLLLMTLLKQLFNRPRPLIPLLEPVKGLSFPSGHAMMSVSFYGLLILLVWEYVTHRFWKWLLTSILVILILLIGFSRIYLRLHYFSDVMAGFAAGIIWLSICVWIIGRMERFSKKEIDPAIADNTVSV